MPRSDRAIASIAIACILPMFAACKSESLGVCELSITFRTQASRTSLRVGDTTSIRASATTCDGQKEVVTSWRYSPANPTIAHVDSLSGLITALAPGSTLILARRLEIPHPETELAITVTP